jgi:UPF0176 protein
MSTITNIAAYHFTPLTDLRERRASLLKQCKAWELKGTILLSHEGINLFVAGAAPWIDALLIELRSWPGLAALEPKVSLTEHQPFTRMLVRLKKEIIAFGIPEINPASRPSRKISAPVLKQWLDEGRPITLLDTRNEYEIKLGTFKKALTLGLDHFRHFPKAVSQLPASLKQQPIVMFCTGGIRCEKAGPYMEREGYEDIYQLEGGILKYFEECGGAHYDGECFVFDQRVGLDPALRETDSALCYVCQTPLLTADQQDPRYVVHRSCPYCFQSSADQMARTIALRHQAIQQAFTPLPGSIPYDNLRPITVPLEATGQPLLEVFSQIVLFLPRAGCEAAFAQGRVLDKHHQPMSPEHRVKVGEFYYHLTPQVTEPDVNPNVTILHEDEALIVLDKPAPLPMHAAGRFHRNTLQYLLNLVYHPQKPRPAHRLDANTTGLVLVTRTRHFAARLQPQFANGQVKKLYLARVYGHPATDTFRCEAAISAIPADHGTREVDLEEGLAAITEFRVLARDSDGTALLEARPLTGRTNQIRVHLWHLGWPICGDPVYRPEGKSATTQTLPPEAPPMCLHAWQIEFFHPLDNLPQKFIAPEPAWVRHEFASL